MTPRLSLWRAPPHFRVFVLILLGLRSAIFRRNFFGAICTMMHVLLILMHVDHCLKSWHRYRLNLAFVELRWGPLMIFRCCPDEGYATNVNIFDRICIGYIGFRNGFFKRIKTGGNNIYVIPTKVEKLLVMIFCGAR